jgi:hypothetical protein
MTAEGVPKIADEAYSLMNYLVFVGGKRRENIGVGRI